MIKAVFSDIDGCIGKFVKPIYPLKQDLNGNLRNLRLIKKMLWRTKIATKIILAFLIDYILLFLGGFY